MKKIKYTLIKDLILITKPVSKTVDRFACQHNIINDYLYFNFILKIKAIIINLKDSNIEL